MSFVVQNVNNLQKQISDKEINKWRIFSNLATLIVKQKKGVNDCNRKRRVTIVKEMSFSDPKELENLNHDIFHISSLTSGSRNVDSVHAHHCGDSDMTQTKQYLDQTESPEISHTSVHMGHPLTETIEVESITRGKCTPIDRDDNLLPHVEQSSVSSIASVSHLSHMWLLFNHQSVLSQ